MAKFLRCDARVSSAYVEFYIGGGGSPTDVSEAWLTYDAYIPSASMASWTDPVAESYVNMVSVNGSLVGTVLQVNMGDPAALSGFYWSGVYGGPESGNSPNPTVTFSDAWHTYELHYSDGVISELYIDGVAVWSVSPSTSGQLDYFLLGANPGLVPDWPGVGFFDNVKFGSTRGGTEYFSDNFESGDLSSWWNVIGDVSIVENFSDPVPPTPPINDDFANAIEISGPFGSVDGTNVLATGDYPGDEWFGSGENVWYKYIAPADGTLHLDTYLKPDDPANIRDTTLTIYTGANFSDLVRQETGDDSGGDPDDPTGGSRSIIETPVVGGTTYWIEVASYGSGEGSWGDFTLRWGGPSAPVENFTTSNVHWNIGVYDRSANPQESTSYDGSVTNEFLKHVTGATWIIPLNGIDTMTFTLYLDDPAALLIHRKQTWIRAWRVVNDPEHSKFRDPPSETPDFCGVVTGITKNADANTMTVTVMGVLWLVQTHFHLLNHRLVNDPADVPVYRDGSNQTDLPWDHSALMYHLIDLINGAFKDSGGDTGIRRPPSADFTGSGYMSGLDLYWPQTIQVGPVYIQKGEYTWPILSDDLLARAASPDIVPEYINNVDSIDTMYFRTAIQRGSDISATFSFDYRTGLNNLEDVTEEAQVPPTEYANFIWISGDGGPNTYANQQTDPGDMAANGVYMKHENIPGAKKSDIQQIADDKIVVSVHADSEIYTVSVSPAPEIPVYYDIDYTVGDLVGLNVDRGAFQVVNGKQRIYQATLQWSDNNVETVELMISADFKRKFPDA